MVLYGDKVRLAILIYNFLQSPYLAHYHHGRKRGHGYELCAWATMTAKNEDKKEFLTIQKPNVKCIGFGFD